jgi:hypothetical protein
VWLVGKSLPLSIDDKNLSASQIMILNWVVERGEVPLEEFIDHIDDLHELLSRRLVRLKISTYAWGTEYLVTLPKTSQRHDLEPK